MIILPANTLSTGGYEVANSCRFNSADQARMNRDLVTATSRQKFTYSFWVKRSTISHQFFVTNSGSTSHIKFDASHRLDVMDEDGNIRYVTNRLFRDVSAWYSIIVAVDTTQAVAGNRVKIYVNGTQETSFSTSTAPDQNYNCTFNTAVNFKYGSYDNDADYNLDGYLAEVVFIDGSQEAATSFGEFDSDSPRIWKPIDVSGLTFGTNGFYLDFEDSANLGNDANGGTDWTETNLAATDQSSDTCTNNFATWNNLISSNGSTSEGNVKYVTSNSSSNYGYRLSTIGVSSGMWYAEVKYTSSSNQALIGIRSREATAVVDYLGKYSDDYAIYVNGVPYNNNSALSDLGASWTSGDIIGIYLDLDNNKLYFSKNGSLYSSTGISITAAASTTTGFYFFSASEWNSSGDGTFELNTGGSPSFSITSSNTDGEYGNFEYSTTITGDGASKTFKALCTKNLAEYG